MAPYDLNYDRWHQRAAVLGLTRRDAAFLARVRVEVIEPHIDLISDAFRNFLDPLYDELPDPVDRDKVQCRQVDYLLGFGDGFDTDAYFDQRFQIGATHVQWAIPLSDYAIAHHYLQGILVGRILHNGYDQHVVASLVESVCRVTALDMALVVHAYHSTQVTSLKEELASQVSETRRFRLHASRDALTGLLNRRGIEARLEQGVARARETGEPVVVGMADLDHFKRVNDEFGHLVGDEVLRIAASRMRGVLRRQKDALGRYGGEEFLFLFPNTTLEAGRVITERMRLAVCNSPFGADGHSVPVSSSFGLSVLRPDDDLASLVGRVDAALYQAKHKGRNRIELGAPKRPGVTPAPPA